MCRKLYLEFWTPSDIRDATLESRAKRGRLTSSENPFGMISRVVYYECALEPRRTRYYRQARCNRPSDGGRQGPIRAFCGGDDGCEVRVKGFRNRFDYANMQLVQARRLQGRGADPRVLGDLERKAHAELRLWQEVFQEHLHCPSRRLADRLVCDLVTNGAMERPVEMVPRRRLGENPFEERV